MADAAGALDGFQAALYGNSLRYGDEKTRRGSSGSPGRILGRKNVLGRSFGESWCQGPIGGLGRRCAMGHRSRFKQLGDGIDRPHPRQARGKAFLLDGGWVSFFSQDSYLTPPSLERFLLLLLRGGVEGRSPSTRCAAKRSLPARRAIRIVFSTNSLESQG
jgi:hypothetical protein